MYCIILSFGTWDDSTVEQMSSPTVGLKNSPLEFEKQVEAGGSSWRLNYCAVRRQPCRIHVSCFSFMSQFRALGQAFVKASRVLWRESKGGRKGTYCLLYRKELDWPRKVFSVEPTHENCICYIKSTSVNIKSIHHSLIFNFLVCHYSLR